ncbi:hypothetical protein K502DRAFT_342324 [Neoconidiobolus thromboides FSU 785]|nr:hypothetical protein K502DRAFT_342324 [Neoconidiobolus thromboides FSU 785]
MNKDLHCHLLKNGAIQSTFDEFHRQLFLSDNQQKLYFEKDFTQLFSQIMEASEDCSNIKLNEDKTETETENILNRVEAKMDLMEQNENKINEIINSEDFTKDKSANSINVESELDLSPIKPNNKKVVKKRNGSNSKRKVLSNKASKRTPTNNGNGNAAPNRDQIKSKNQRKISEKEEKDRLKDSETKMSILNNHDLLNNMFDVHPLNFRENMNWTPTDTFIPFKFNGSGFI